MNITMKICNSIRTYQHPTTFKSLKSATETAQQLMSNQDDSVHYVVLEYVKDGLRFYNKVTLA